MAARNWTASILTAAGVAAGAGAAQLGIGYGLGIITWVPATEPTGRVAWLASLAWVVWVAATSAVIGAITARWLTDPSGPVDSRAALVRGAWRLALALAAAVG